MKMERLALEEGIVSHSWTSRSNEHFQEFPVLEHHIYHFPLKRGIFLLLVEWKTWGKITKTQNWCCFWTEMKHLIYHVASPSTFLWGLAHCIQRLQAEKVLWLGMERFIPTYLLFLPQNLPQGGRATAIWSMLSSWGGPAFSLLRDPKNKGHTEICFWFEKKNLFTSFLLYLQRDFGVGIGISQYRRKLDFLTVHPFLTILFKENRFFKRKKNVKEKQRVASVLQPSDKIWGEQLVLILFSIWKIGR